MGKLFIPADAVPPDGLHVGDRITIGPVSGDWSPIACRLESFDPVRNEWVADIVYPEPTPIEWAPTPRL